MVTQVVVNHSEIELHEKEEDPFCTIDIKECKENDDGPVLPESTTTDVLNQIQSYSYVNLKKTRWRYLVLFLACSFQFFSYIADQTPSPLQAEILARYQCSNVQYNLMFALDGYLDIFGCIITGALIHEKRLGLHRTMILFSLFIVFGNSIFTLSAHYGLTALALVGRVFAGLGIEC